MKRRWRDDLLGNQGVYYSCHGKNCDDILIIYLLLLYVIYIAGVRHCKIGKIVHML